MAQALSSRLRAIVEALPVRPGMRASWSSAAGRLSLREAAAEGLELAPGEAPHDLAFAIRVSALDDHPPRGRPACHAI